MLRQPRLPAGERLGNRFATATRQLLLGYRAVARYPRFTSHFYTALAAYMV